nr:MULTISPECIES: uracil-DNA glycosylase [unclassified Paenibacillus]
MKNANSLDNERINCFLCKHFYVTWDPSFPRGCRLYEFKTSELPSAVVKRSSGKPCMAFEKKQ